MATVYVGSARGDENGKAHGGKAGDQKKGKEVSTQAWYKHSKGWRVIRPVSTEAAAKIALQMQAACDTDLLGYDQWQRDTLLKAVQGKGYDIRKLDKAVETDCSALVRVCCAYAYGHDIVTGDARWSTANMCSRLLATGLFTEMKGTQYTNKPDYLRAGDILCTKTQGHTVVVLNNGDKAGNAVVEPEAYKPGERLLRNGCEGDDVKDVQSALLQLGYDLGKWGADGDFGDCTEIAVEMFQRAHGLTVDGIVGPSTLVALDAALAELDAPTVNAQSVRIEGGQCWVRSAPNTNGTKLGIVKAGTVLTYGGETSQTGWLLVEYDGKNGWVSGKYGKLTA